MHRAIPSGGSNSNNDDHLQYQFENAQYNRSSIAFTSTTYPSWSPPKPLQSSSNARPSTAGNALVEGQHLPNGITATFSTSSNTSPESRRRRPSGTVNRSNSISVVRDGVGNLNRWSQSTTSSKGSHSHKRSSSFSQRINFGGSASLRNGAQEAPTTSKLTKTRPSAGERSQKPGSSERLYNSSTTLLPSLPPIITLPALETTHDGSSPLTATSNTTPSTARLLSAAVHATVPDYFGKVWEDSRSIPLETSQLKSAAQTQPPVGDIPGLGGPHLKPASSVSSTTAPRRDGSVGQSTHRSRTPEGRGISSQSSERSKSKERSSKQPSQKAMLSKALQKANTAVLLDNAQNFEGAMQAYSEACNLLRQVMDRSSGDEDKRKLEAIRNTYTSRIKELEKIAPHLASDEKALPARPQSNQGSYQGTPISPHSTGGDSMVIGAATVARIIDDDTYMLDGGSRRMQTSQLPLRRESLAPTPSYDKLPTNNVFEHYREQKTARKYPVHETVLDSANLSPPTNDYMPPPLSPRPLLPKGGTPPQAADNAPQPLPSGPNNGSQAQSGTRSHSRAASTESMSWLDTIDESGGSTASSVHSRTSSLRVRRKHIRAASGATEAEFDAALDAAVEAAYDEGFEPEAPFEPPLDEDFDNDVVVNVRRRVELAKERVRQTERETSIQLAKDRERTRILQEKRDKHASYDSYDGNESEEEERMLEEMTRGYVMDDFEFGLQTKSALPRESDSSGFSGRTWNSSIGSNPTTSGTNLSTVAEKSTIPKMPGIASDISPPLHPPPSQALPPPPLSVPPPSTQLPNLPPPTQSTTGIQSVRSRRLSGQNAKQLKIDTLTRAATPPSLPPAMPLPKAPIPALPQTAGVAGSARQQLSISSGRSALPHTARQASSPFPGPSPSEVITPPTPTLAQTLNDDIESAVRPETGSPVRAQSRSELRKNLSSSSLKNVKSRNLSVSAPDDFSDVSPNTPLSGGFGISPRNRDPPSRLPTMPALPTSVAAAFKEKMNGAHAGGMFLFDSDIHSPNVPHVASSASTNSPIPLEPCPKEFLLRPFWLMRALYQTICHPRGGYLSTKLFVPRDVWRVKGVKIKGIEDKIANCDFLTAALQKLAQVDTYDADSVLDEMQSMEAVLDQVQAVFTKKLGSEVGVQGSGMLFRDGTNTGDADVNSGSKTPSGSKSFSWRRLRSKNSGAGLSNSYNAKSVPTAGDISKDNVTMATLPMGSMSTARFTKRDVSSVQFSGPNANYMAALARLFDAAQVIGMFVRA